MKFNIVFLPILSNHSLSMNSCLTIFKSIHRNTNGKGPWVNTRPAGSSFILTKKSLQAVGHSGRQRAQDGGLSYLTQRLWWAGMASREQPKLFFILANKAFPDVLLYNDENK